MRFIVLILLAAFAGAVPVQRAAADAVLVELFTSQGCSSCPAADALLHDLAERDDVVALAFHVDYWDYLGWKDTFAKASYTQRQRSYAPQVNREFIGRPLRGSFTPEIVVQGTDSLVGSAKKAVLSRIAAHAAGPKLARIGLMRDGGVLKVTLAPVEERGQAVRVMLARFTPMARVEVLRGENAGRTLVYNNVVTELTQIGRWDGRGPASLTAKDDGGAVAVFLQRGTAGPVIAAEALR